MVQVFLLETYFPSGWLTKRHSSNKFKTHHQPQGIPFFCIRRKRLVPTITGGWGDIDQDGRNPREFGGQKFVGRWKWDSGFYCRQGRFEGQEIGKTIAALSNLMDSGEAVSAEQRQGALHQLSDFD